MSVETNEWYKEMVEIDESRIKNDILLRIIVTENAGLNEIVESVVDELLNIYPKMSMRLKAMLTTIRNDTSNSVSSRVLKHGLLFFALSNEPWVIDILSSRGSIPPQRYELFYESSLIPGSKKLLNGVLTSLWAYVEQIRGEYITT